MKRKIVYLKAYNIDFILGVFFAAIFFFVNNPAATVC